MRATGRSRNAGILSVFLLALDEQGEITGVRSTNGAPFRLYQGAEAPGIKTECSTRALRPPGCGSVIHGIHFDYDSAAIPGESNALLDALATGLKNEYAGVIAVIGHTSSEGSDSYSEDLSRRRAESVVAALGTRGIDGARLAAEGRGEQQAIADNTTEAGRSLNRRVEIDCR